MTPPVSPRVQWTPRQRTCLEQIIRRQTSPPRLGRRAKMLLALATGANACHGMRQRHRNRGTGRAWRPRWLAFAPQREQREADEGSAKTLWTMIVAALTEPPRPGPPATFTAAQMVQRVAVACADPTESGRPVSHWTPRAGAAEVRHRGLGATISPRSVGRVLHAGRLTAPARGIRAPREAGCSRGVCCRGGRSRCGVPARASGRPARGARQEYR
jgi:putative transposase